MNPRKRRAIARAITAGIPADELTSERLAVFLEKERLNLNLTDAEIVEISGVTDQTKPTEDTNSAPKKKNTKKKIPNALRVTYSMKNTKSQLLKAAKKLGIEVNTNMNKSAILELINA